MNINGNGGAIEGAGGQLAAELIGAIETLEELLRHSERLGPEVSTRINETVRDGRERLGRRQVRVCVVGEQKTGKSTFLNALLRFEVLGSAVRECTGSVTRIRVDDRLHYRAMKSSGGLEDLNTFHPDEHDVFSAKVVFEEAKIKECEGYVVSLPGEIKNIQARSEEMKLKLPGLKRDFEVARYGWESSKALYEKLAEDARLLDETVRMAEHKIPEAYRRVGKWTDVNLWGARLAMALFSRGEWHKHLARVEKLEKLEKVKQTQKTKAGEAGAAATRAQDEVKKQERATAFEEQQVHTLARRLAGLSQEIPAWRRHASQTQEIWKTNREQRQVVLIERVKQLTDMNREGSDVEGIELTVPTQRLPEWLVVIDTPGVNTASEVNKERAWRVIREEADACILLSDISQALGESTREFVRQVREVVPHLLLVFTKMDAAMRSAQMSGEDATEQVRAAVQAARVRFAEECGRPESEILSCGVSARPALKDPEGQAGQDFNDELRRLFEVVYQERMIAAASRCAKGMERLYQETSGVADRAEGAYVERIRMLEEQQIKDPKAFCEGQASALGAQVKLLARDVSAELRATLPNVLRQLREELVKEVEGANNVEALRVRLEAVSDKVTAGINSISDDVSRKVDQGYGRQVEELITGVRAPLRERYRIAESISAAVPRQMPLRIFSPMAGVVFRNEGAKIKKRIKDHIAQNNAIAGSAGRNMARAKSPGAVLAFAAVGLIGVALQGNKFQQLRRDCELYVEKCFHDMETQLLSESSVGEAAMGEHIRAGLVGVAMQDVVDFKGWIDGVIKEEKEALEKEKLLLGHLREVRERMSAHDGRIKVLMGEATNVCAGLSRATPGNTGG